MRIKTNALANRTICINKIDFCCNNMKKAYEQGFISFGEVDQEYNYEKKVNLAHCDNYTDGAVWDTMQIKYCPFCSTVIIIE